MLILGSSSPRRKEILSFFKIPFFVVTPDFDELSVPYCNNPHAYVAGVAEGKGKAIAPHHPGIPILTADTIVVKGTQVFLKPSHPEEAITMLEQLCGTWHEVLTATTLTQNEQQSTQVTTTRVEFHPFNRDEIRRYVDSIPVLDKSGSYAIQGIGSLIVKQIEGCFYNVMGLPLSSLFYHLNRCGFNIWDHLKKPSF